MSREKQLEKLVVALEARTAKYQQDLDKAGKKSKTFSKNTQRDMAAVKNAVLGLGFAFATKKIIDATAKQEKAVKQLEQGLISTGHAAGLSLSELTKYASELQNATTFGDEDIIASMSQLATFTKITGDEFKNTMKAALDLSTRMDQDLKSSVVQLGKALNDPTANLSALSRAGIQFSDDQKKTIKSLVEMGRMVDAQKIILKELEVQFGGSAVAARETFGGALEGLNNAFGDLLESSGGLEDARNSIEGLTSLLQDENVVKGVNTLTAAIVSGFAGAINLITQTVNVIEFLAEEFAAFVYGPAIGDMVRIEEAIADIKGEIQELEGVQSRSNAPKRRLEILKKELEGLEQKKKITESLNGLKRGELVIPIKKGIQETEGPLDRIHPKDRPVPETDPKSEEKKRQFKFITDPENLNKFSTLMDEYGVVAENTAAYIESSFTAAFDSMTNNMSRGLAQAIVEGESLKDVFGQVAKTLAVDLVAGLIKVGLQMLINAAIGNSAQAAGVVSAVAAGQATAAAWSTAAALASLASFGGNAVPAQLGISSTVGLSKAFALTGMAHDGIANVPKEGTWLLDKGERVLSARQNKDFSDYMKEGGGQAVNVTNVFQISAGVEGTVKSEIEKLLPAIQRLSVSSVEKAIRGGGSMARAVGAR